MLDLKGVIPKACPFCGRASSLDDGETLYPNGTGWKPFRGYRSYVSHREVPQEQWCYTMHCPEISGGCGAEISGDSELEALEKWNRRPE